MQRILRNLVIQQMKMTMKISQILFKSWRWFFRKLYFYWITTVLRNEWRNNEYGIGGVCSQASKNCNSYFKWISINFVYVLIRIPPVRVSLQPCRLFWRQKKKVFDPISFHSFFFFFLFVSLLTFPKPFFTSYCGQEMITHVSKRRRQKCLLNLKSLTFILHFLEH
jgi:hypothetical protein